MPTGIAAGLHAVLREHSAVKAAAWQGLALDGLAAFRHPDSAMSTMDGLVVGYATSPEHAHPAAIDALCRALPPA